MISLLTKFFRLILIACLLININYSQAMSGKEQTALACILNKPRVTEVAHSGASSANFKASNVPDDIVEPTRWLKEQTAKNFALPIIPEAYQNAEPKIRERQHYRINDIANSDDLIVFVVIHGTFGNKTKAYFDEQDSNYRSIKRTAAWYATIKHKNLELLSYRWDGELSDNSRKDAAKTLLNLFYAVKEYRDAEKVLLSHSHGGNIVNYLSRIIAPDKPIALIMHFGCPTREEPENQPLHYKTLLYFHSDSDWTTIGGRANERDV
ncbi:MAG: hypothetical protein ACYC2U_08815, partial [Candidatus Amoebophilus sp.]